MELIRSKDTDTSFESCHEFICQLIEKSPKKVRGPYLARLELHRMMREEKADAVALLGQYSQLLLEYFRNFGDRNCCPHDLKVFCRHLSAEEYQTFPQQLMQMAPLAEDGSCSTETMMKYICAVQVSRFWDTTDRSKAALEALAAKMIKLYGEYNKRFEGKLLTTDISPCDQFIVLAGELQFSPPLPSYVSLAITLFHVATHQLCCCCWLAVRANFCALFKRTEVGIYERNNCL